MARAGLKRAHVIKRAALGKQAREGRLEQLLLFVQANIHSFPSTGLALRKYSTNPIDLANSIGNLLGPILSNTPPTLRLCDVNIRHVILLARRNHTNADPIVI